MFPRDVKRTAMKLFTQLDTPRSLTCAILLRNGEMDQLVDLTVDPRSYDPYYHDGVNRLRRDLQATELLRKCDGLELDRDLEAAAVEGFYASEKQCKATNDSLQFLLDLPVSTTKIQKRMRGVVEAARAWLKAVLGKVPDTLDGRFGPGATFESNTWGGRRFTAYDKLSHEPSITPAAAYLEDHAIWQAPFGLAWGNAVPDRWIPRTRGNRFTTVAKDATKRRGICIEPGANLIMQLAVGGALRARLKRVGIDLENGQDLHRFLAQFASELGHLATIDLSNASDTVAYILVKLLLPEEWFTLLDSLRSPFTYLEKGTERSSGWVRLEKFSSMGNGFTFELETLLFCALLHAVGCHIGIDTFVYGDDIICPTERSSDALAVLRAFGFTPNPRKTFTQGHFRESCGGDFFAGQAVRPYYLKELPDDAADWIKFANGLWRSSKRLELPSIMAARNSALDNVPSDIRRCRGPEALGDLVVTEDNEDLWSSSVRNSIRYIRVWRPVIPRNALYYRRRIRDARFGPPQPGKYTWVTTRRSKRYCKGVDHAAALLGLPSDGLSPRNSVEGYRFGRIAWS